MQKAKNGRRESALVGLLVDDSDTRRAGYTASMVSSSDDELPDEKLPPPRPLFSFDHDDRADADPRQAPPAMRSELPMLYPPPKHIVDEPTEPEPLRPSDNLPALQAAMAARDAERLAHPSRHPEPVVVYDSRSPIDLDVNPFRTETELSTIAAPSGSLSPLVEGRRLAEGAAAGEADATAMSSSVASADDGAAVAVPPPLTSAASSRVRMLAPPLAFESRFESGNLRRATRIDEHEYDLEIAPDMNTRGNTQWFYFGVTNALVGVPYKFNIVNCVKPDSLFNAGMLPLVYSTEAARSSTVGWRRRGESVCYYQNRTRRRGAQYFYTLTFSLVFAHVADVCYLAYCYPHTLTDLRLHLRRLQSSAAIARRLRRRSLCTSLAGNRVEVLTITSFTSSAEELASRKGVFISARVHPGETNASYMMEGILDYLTGPSLGAKALRDSCVFKIVPMLNPDGVVAGNYRCSLAGVDLNRMWKAPSKWLTPSIYHAKRLVQSFVEDRQVLMFVDLHGHSRKQNIFAYGCDGRGPDGKLTPPPGSRRNEMELAWSLSRTGQAFYFPDCSFKVQRKKESTARVVSYRELGIQTSLTIEASFAGASVGPCAGRHFGPRELREAGAAFCEGLLEHFATLGDTMQLKNGGIYSDLYRLYPNGAALGGDDSAGSDDNPSEDCADIVHAFTRRKKAPRSPRGKRPTEASAAADQECGEAALAPADDNNGGASEMQAPPFRRRPPMRSRQRAASAGGNGRVRSGHPAPAGGGRRTISSMSSADASSAWAVTAAGLPVKRMVPPRAGSYGHFSSSAAAAQAAHEAHASDSSAASAADKTGGGVEYRRAETSARGRPAHHHAASANGRAVTTSAPSRVHKAGGLQPRIGTARTSVRSLLHELKPAGEIVPDALRREGEEVELHAMGAAVDPSLARAGIARLTQTSCRSFERRQGPLSVSSMPLRQPRVAGRRVNTKPG